jgi:hypothetical protein
MEYMNERYGLESKEWSERERVGKSEREESKTGGKE